MNRAVLRPEEHRFAYLAFGPDEFRQIGLLSLVSIISGVVYVMLVMAFTIVLVLLDSVAQVPPAIVGIFAVLAASAVMIWLAVRLSLASALTFEERRVILIGSWSLTRGRFWPIFGTYVLVFALASVIFLLTWLVILATVALATGGNLGAAFAPPDLRSFGGYFTVAQVVQLILGAVVSAMMWPVVLTPPAAILRQISSAGEMNLAERGIT